MRAHEIYESFRDSFAQMQGIDFNGKPKQRGRSAVKSEFKFTGKSRGVEMPYTTTGGIDPNGKVVSNNAKAAYGPEIDNTTATKLIDRKSPFKWLGKGGQ